MLTILRLRKRMKDWPEELLSEDLILAVVMPMEHISGSLITTVWTRTLIPLSHGELEGGWRLRRDDQGWARIDPPSTHSSPFTLSYYGKSFIKTPPFLRARRRHALSFLHIFICCYSCILASIQRYVNNYALNKYGIHFIVCDNNIIIINYVAYIPFIYLNTVHILQALRT